jgi:putative tricarboxylic transport membrane protein
VAKPARKDFASGAVLIAIGGFFAFSGRNLAMAEGGAMGAGYFPRLLAATLMVLGAAILLMSVRGAMSPPDRPSPMPWRGLAMISLALVWFAMTVRPLGLGLALAGAIGLSCAASSQSRWKQSVALTAGVVLFAWLVFVLALKMPVPLLGTWLR